MSMGARASCSPAYGGLDFSAGLTMSLSPAQCAEMDAHAEAEMVRLYGVHWRQLHTITQTRVMNWDKFVCRLCTTNPEEPKTLWGTCECARHVKSRGHQSMSAHVAWASQAHQSSLPLPLPKGLAVAVFHSMPKAWQPPIGKPPPLRQPPPPTSPPPTRNRVQAIDYPHEESEPVLGLWRGRSAGRGGVKERYHYSEDAQHPMANFRAPVDENWPLQ